MAKTKGKRKHQGPQIDTSSKKLKTAAIVTPPPDKSQSPPDVEPKNIQAIGLDQEDIELAIDTLHALSENPSVIKSKACKDLRTAVYEFRQSCTTGFNATGLWPVETTNA